jgi:hypothetical protein
MLKGHVTGAFEETEWDEQVTAKVEGGGTPNAVMRIPSNATGVLLLVEIRILPTLV